MIIDFLERRHNYSHFPLLHDMLGRIEDLIAVKTDIRENKMISSVTLKSKKKEDYLFEAHCKYIDIHYIIQGIEGIAVADIKNLKEVLPYEEERDIAFYRIHKHPSSLIYLMSGMFLICWPHEAHCTAIMRESPSEIKKIVAKVPFIDKSFHGGNSDD